MGEVLSFDCDCDTVELGTEAFAVLVAYGLAEFICPTRRAGTWVVYPRTGRWRQLATRVAQAVEARSVLDYQWELFLEGWVPSPDASTDIATPPPSLPPTPLQG